MRLFSPMKGSLFLGLILAARVWGSPCLTDACHERLELAPGRHLTVYRSFSAAEPGVDSAVFVIHGTLRNADEYYLSVVAAAKAAGATESTLLVAPHFKTADDGPAPAELYWTGSGWKQGAPSVNPGRRMSSYEALDGVIGAFASRFPNLRRIVVTGHSAGGQVVSRYVAASPLDKGAGPIAFRYVIANPSTYFYPTAHRPDASGGFEVPEAAGCPDYDEYPYGLRGAVPYVARVGADGIERNLQSRDITIFLGAEDTGTELLDMSCGANLQGANRRERGENHHRYLERFFRPASLGLEVVPGVGHSGDGMYRSPQGQALLFGK